MSSYAKLIFALPLFLLPCLSQAGPDSDVPALALQKTQLAMPSPFRGSLPAVTARSRVVVAVQPKPLASPMAKPLPAPVMQAMPAVRTHLVEVPAPVKNQAPKWNSQATLVFTATRLNKGFQGSNVGVGALELYEPGGQCELPPRSLSGLQEVTADQPEKRFQIPAGQPLELSSFWSAGGSHCLLGNYSFTAEQGGTYKLTSVQDLVGGVCRLRMQKLAEDSGRFVADNTLRQSPGGCQSAALDL